jgi:hypothetical protein
MNLYIETCLKTSKFYNKSIQKRLYNLMLKKTYKKEVLEASWSVLRASWERLGASWNVLGTFWERLGSVLGASWERLGRA